MHINNCANCSNSFDIPDQDKVFYGERSVPEPTQCPTCREIRRMCWRNERTLYKRKCTLCSKSMVSTYSENKPFPVYCQACYWSDYWNAQDYNFEINFNETFADQFEKLQNITPRLGILNKQSENSDYCNFSFANKNCYLTFGCHYEEDCLYGHYSTKNKNCIDYDSIYESELCYELTFSHNCYKCIYLDHSENCNECFFSYDLKGCKNCVFCSNLRHKQYCILNVQYTEEEYYRKLESYNFKSYKIFKEGVDYFRSGFRKTFPFRNRYIVNCENCEGNELTNCKNLKNVYAAENCEDCTFGYRMDNTYSSSDNTCMGYDKCEVCYQSIGINGSSFLIACDSVWHSSEVLYSSQCFTVQDCFGCIGLNQKRNNILNREYSKEEYESLKLQLIQHMKNTGEWGEFFLSQKSPYGYNESVAGDVYPLTKDEAIAKGFQWEDFSPDVYDPVTYEIEDSIEDVESSILGHSLGCIKCNKQYKLTHQELGIYKDIGVPVPRECFQCRFRGRLNNELYGETFDRNCDKCKKTIQSTYPKGRPETIYCQECYLKEVY